MPSGYDELRSLAPVYSLKRTYRQNPVGQRRESTAEHTFSSLVLADFLMLRYDLKADRGKVMGLILYHDLVEAHAGDTPLHPGKSGQGQAGRERAAANALMTELPPVLAARYRDRYAEFGRQQTREARLARAIEQLDAVVHELDYKEDWRGWTEGFLRGSKEPCLRGFPELQELFDGIVSYLHAFGYFGGGARESRGTVTCGALSDICRLRIIYRMKGVYRFNSVTGRRESAAEHTFSSLVLADYLMTRYDFGVDTQRVLDMLLYHDLVEIHAGDTPLGPGLDRSGQPEVEVAAARQLSLELPFGLADRYLGLYREFSAMRTTEARLANAFDKLDAEVHELDYKEDWRGWTEGFLRGSKGAYFRGFPALERLFEEHVRYLRENGYFDIR